MCGRYYSLFDKQQEIIGVNGIAPLWATMASVSQ
jgi:hypothetical protein